MLLVSVSSYAADAQMQQALAQCQDGKFDEAINTYEAILGGGRESATLYYNLGYAYYKTGQLGKAILNMERAHRLAPNDPDIEANLEQAYSLTDQMQTIEPIFFVRWWHQFTNIFNSNGWAIAFIVLFVIMLLGIGSFLFADIIALRKVGFFTAIIVFCLSIVALSISISQRNDVLNSQEAIIMSASVTLTTSPDKNGTEMAVLHEGTHLSIISELGEWIEVQLKDGNIGWLRKSEVEVI